jgi:hypothetical protein
MELQRERKSEAQLLESLEASSPPDSGDPQDGGPGLRQPAASHPSATGMAQTSSCEVCDVPKGQAGTGDSSQPVPGEFGDVRHEERAITPIAGGTAALLIFLGAVLAAFKKIKNRGNELKDLLQRQGITEIATSKRTHFCVQNVRFEAKKSTISGARPAVVRAGRACVPRHLQDKLSHNRPFRRWAVHATHVAARGRAQMSLF